MLRPIFLVRLDDRVSKTQATAFAVVVLNELAPDLPRSTDTEADLGGVGLRLPGPEAVRAAGVTLHDSGCLSPRVSRRSLTEG